MNADQFGNLANIDLLELVPERFFRLRENMVSLTDGHDYFISQRSQLSAAKGLGGLSAGHLFHEYALKEYGVMFFMLRQ